MSKSTLSSVVSNIVRASMGTAVSSTVTDEDLDRHIAELILKEAKQKAERYGKDGIRAYLPQPGYSESNAPKTNKRFLSSIIRSTDDHNRTILRAQALAAEEVRMERREEEKRERRARAEEAVEAERMRRLMGGGGTVWADNWKRGEKREGKRRERSWETRDDYESDYTIPRERESGHRSGRSEGRRRHHYHHHHHRSRSGERHSRRDDDKRSRRSRSRSPRRRSRSPIGSDHGTRRKHGRERVRSKSPPPDSSSRRRRRSDEERSRSPSPSPARSQAPELVEQHGLRKGHRGSQLPSPEGRSRSRSTDKRSALTSRKPSLEPRSVDDDGGSDKLSREETSLSRRVDTPKHSSTREPSESAPVPSSSSHTLPSRSPSSRPHKRATRSRPRSPSTSPPPLPSDLPSKMDKYFHPSYDPRLDVAPLNVPSVPATGLIPDADYAGWDAMLELIRQKREDKEEKKRLERWGISKDKDNDKKRKTDDGDRWGSGELDIMQIEYKKRGSVREWDLGKEGF